MARDMEREAQISAVIEAIMACDAREGSYLPDLRTPFGRAIAEAAIDALAKPEPIPSKTARRDRATKPYVTALLLGSGYAAVMMVTVEVLNEAGEVVKTYPDVQQTGIGRYQLLEEAINEAKQWAKAEVLEYR